MCSHGIFQMAWRLRLLTLKQTAWLWWWILSHDRWSRKTILTQAAPQCGVTCWRCTVYCGRWFIFNSCKITQRPGGWLLDEMKKRFVCGFIIGQMGYLGIFQMAWRLGILTLKPTTLVVGMDIIPCHVVMKNNPNTRRDALRRCVLAMRCLLRPLIHFQFM